MPLGLTKNQDFSKFRGLLGRSERSLSLAAPKGMQLDFVIAALTPAGGFPSGLYAGGCLQMFLLLHPSLALLVFPSPSAPCPLSLLCNVFLPLPLS